MPMRTSLSAHTIPCTPHNEGAMAYIYADCSHVSSSTFPSGIEINFPHFIIQSHRDPSYSDL